MLAEKVNVLRIVERAIKFTEDADVKATAGKVMRNTEIELFREIVEKAYAKDGLTPRTVKLSQRLDGLIAAEQRKRLQACC